VTVKEKAEPEVTEAGMAARVKEVACAGLTVTEAELATLLVLTLAEMVTAPAVAPVKEEVKTPDPIVETGPKEPVPPTAEDWNAMRLVAGTPEGFKLPRASFMVSVARMEEPEVTEELERLTTLVAREKGPGFTVMEELVAERGPSEKVRV
jgi:hypothetical protein